MVSRSWLSRLARFKFRFDFSFMATPATNRALSAIEFLDDAVHHAEHFTRFFLSVFVVFFPLIWYMTMTAPDTKRVGKKVHDHRHSTRRDAFQLLDIVEH